MSKDYLLPSTYSFISRLELKSKKQFSNDVKSSKILIPKLFSMKLGKNIDSKKERDMGKILDTVVVPKPLKLPKIHKYLNKTKIFNKTKITNDPCSIVLNEMNDFAIKQRNYMMAKNSILVNHQKEFEIPQIYYHEQLLEFVKAIEFTPMQNSWITNIVKKSKMVCLKKTKAQESLIDEIRNECINTMKKLQVHGVINPILSNDVSKM